MLQTQPRHSFKPRVQPHLLLAQGLAAHTPVPRDKPLCPGLRASRRGAPVFDPHTPPRYLEGTAGAVDLRSPPLRSLDSGGDAELDNGPGPGPSSLQAASPLGEGEALEVAAAPPSPEALTRALLELFSAAGDLGKKLYSVLCRDIATGGKAQPLYPTERLEAKDRPRGACWREIWGGGARRAGGILAPATNPQAPRRARAVS